MNYYIKLWDNEKIEINKDIYIILERGVIIDHLIIKKIGVVSVPLKNIKLWYYV